MTRVKICGITTIDDALACAQAGADLLGLNFYPPSPRSITPEQARQITDVLRDTLGDGCPLLVGVFVNDSAAVIRAIMDVAGLDAAQLSGDEPLETLAALEGKAFKALRPHDPAEATEQARAVLTYAPPDSRLPVLLVDAYHKELYGGTGEQASLDVALAVQGLTPRLLLAGGLTPDNVAARVQAIQPWGVDVASGVENGQPGIKDQALVQAFIVSAKTREA